VTGALAEREVPGLAELMRAEGMRKTRRAALSRGVVAVRKGKLIVNLPGSPEGRASRSPASSTFCLTQSMCSRGEPDMQFEGAEVSAFGNIRRPGFVGYDMLSLLQEGRRKC